MDTSLQAKEAYKITSRHGIANVVFNKKLNHYSLHAELAFTIGDIIIGFGGATIQNQPTYLTLQTGKDRHITLSPEFLQYINHSCDPNVFFDTIAMQLVCIKQIQAGDEMCFFYPSTEWEMIQPFICSCGTNHCLQIINGAAQLTAETLGRYQLTDFILQQVKQSV